jgi:hypothetical protein
VEETIIKLNAPPNIASLHRPCVGGGNEYQAKRVSDVGPSTDPASVEETTFQLCVQAKRVSDVGPSTNPASVEETTFQLCVAAVRLQDS